VLVEETFLAFHFGVEVMDSTVSEATIKLVITATVDVVGVDLAVFEWVYTYLLTWYQRSRC